MKNNVSFIKIIGLISTIILMSGCNTMMSSLDTIKYGKLYTMQESFEIAAHDCNSQNRTNALNWAMIGYQDLNNSRDYLEKNSQEYRDVRNLMRDLSTIASRRIDDTEKLCSNIAIISNASKHFLASLDNQYAPIVVASK